MNIEIAYTVLRAVPDVHRGDALSFGLVLWTPSGPRVWVEDASVKRLRALGPNYRRWDAQTTQASLQAELAKLEDEAMQRQMLGFLVSDPSPQEGRAVLRDDASTIDAQVQHLAEDLLARLVRVPAATLPKVARQPSKRPTRLVNELRAWLRDAKAYSTKVDDLGRGKVVANYPIDPGADLYADFAVLNGKLNAIETLDLRGVDRLTPTLRGDAAIKGITLDEAREHIDGRRIAVVSASDYGVARPAIHMIGRYADEVFDMHEQADRQRLANFIASALHREQLPELSLAQG